MLLYWNLNSFQLVFQHSICFHSITSACPGQQNSLEFLSLFAGLKRGNVFEYYLKILSKQGTTHKKINERIFIRVWEAHLTLYPLIWMELHLQMAVKLQKFFAFASDTVSLTSTGSQACLEEKSKILTGLDDQKSQTEKWCGLGRWDEETRLHFLHVP